MRILLVENNEPDAQVFARDLKQAGCAVDTALTAKYAIDLGSTEPYALILLELDLQDQPGLNVLSALREAKIETPVVVLSHNDNWQLKVECLRQGADDYLVKPFHIEELIARMRVIVNRSQRNLPGLLALGDVELNEDSACARRSNQPWKQLTRMEIAMLRLLITRAGKVVTRQHLVDQMYDLDGSRDSNTLEVYVNRLRNKLGSDLIETRRGQGYTIKAPQTLHSMPRN